MILITDKPISPELVVNKVKTDSSGCVVTYVGLIRDNSMGKPVLSVEYEDAEGKAESRLSNNNLWTLFSVTVMHRVR